MAKNSVVAIIHDNPYKIYYKYINRNSETFSPFNCFDIELFDINLDILYPDGRPIEKKKYKELLQLLPYVFPRVFMFRHDFHWNLETNNSAPDTEVDFYNDDLTQD